MVLDSQPKPLLEPPPWGMAYGRVSVGSILGMGGLGLVPIGTNTLLQKFDGSSSQWICWHKGLKGWVMGSLAWVVWGDLKQGVVFLSLVGVSIKKR